MNRGYFADVAELKKHGGKVSYNLGQIFISIINLILAHMVGEKCSIYVQEHKLMIPRLMLLMELD